MLTYKYLKSKTKSVCVRSRLGLYHTWPYHPQTVVSKVRLGQVVVKQGNQLIPPLVGNPRCYTDFVSVIPPSVGDTRCYINCKKTEVLYDL